MKKHLVILTAAALITAAAGAEAAQITEQQAIDIALKHAGLEAGQTQFKKLKFDKERNGRSEYKLHFYAGDNEFKYEIDAVNGIVTGFSQEIGREPVYGDEKGFIGEDKAVAAALAKVPGAQPSDVKKLRLDRGEKSRTAKYKGVIFHGLKEYKFDIDARSGEFLSWEIDY